MNNQKTIEWLPQCGAKVSVSRTGDWTCSECFWDSCHKPDLRPERDEQENASEHEGPPENDGPEMV